MGSAIRKFIFIVVSLVVVTLWLAAFNISSKNLKVIACDVGQGDAILLIVGTTEVLVDGGPNGRVIDCLSRYMPFWDRSIEVVVLTHPEKDHYQGLIDVVKDYDVQLFVANALDSSSQEYQVLKEEVGRRGIKVLNPNSGMSIRAGLIHLDILHPAKKFLAENLGNFSEGKKTNVLGAYTSKTDANDFSIVSVLSFGDFDAVLTGDMAPDVSQLLAKELAEKDYKSVEYIKVPHHGSKNGLTKEFLDVVDPKVAVISLGKDNSYGHPHVEILKMLNDKGVKILRTDEAGDVIIESDGEKFWPG